MESLALFALPTNLLGWITLFGFVIFGAISLYGQFSKTKKETSEETNEANDRLIRLLKDQVDALEKKVEEQEIILKDTNAKLEILVSENKTLRDVLQGRDDATREYQNKALEAVAIAPKVLDIVTRVDGNVQKMLGKRGITKES